MKTFWCKTHLEYLPISKQSPDGRYCQNCYDFLIKEAKLESKKKSWMPNPTEYPVYEPAKSSRTLGQTVVCTSDNNTKMSQKNERDIMIRELHCHELSSRKIAETLRRSGIEVSYKTVQRVLKDRLHNS